MNYRETDPIDVTQGQGPQPLCAQRACGLYPGVTPFLSELVGSVDGHSMFFKQSDTEG